MKMKVAFAIALLSMVWVVSSPLQTSESNSFKSCPPLIAAEWDSFGTALKGEPKPFESLFMQQRQETTCSDLSLARAIYMFLCGLAVIGMLVQLRGRQRRGLLLASLPSALLVVAATADGPIVPLLLVAIASQIGWVSLRRQT